MQNYTAEEIADKLGVTARTVRRWIELGWIMGRPRKVGGRWVALISESEIERFMGGAKSKGLRPGGWKGRRE